MQLSDLTIMITTTTAPKAFGVATAPLVARAPLLRAIAAETQEYEACVNQLAVAFSLNPDAARSRFRAYHTRRPHSWRECYHAVLSGRADW